jgi:hypothetical protein
MSLTIPIWLLWVLGIVIGVPLLVVAIVLAIIGAHVLWTFRHWSWP